MGGKKKALGQVSDAAGDSVRRLITNAPGGMAQGRYENLIKWAQSNGDTALAAKLTSGQITPDELHQVNMAYFSGKAAKPMADAPARQMELPMDDGPPPNDLRPLFNDQDTWEETGNIAARILNEGPRGMVPYGVRGPGVPVGGPSGPGVAGDLSGPGTRQGQLINDPRMSDPDYIDPEFRVTPNQPPAVVQRGMIDPSNPSRSPREMPRGLSTDVDLPRLGDGVLRGDATSPPRGRQYRGSGAGGRPINEPRGRGALKAAAGTAVGGGIAWNMWPREDGDRPASGDLTDTFGTEALAEESRPVPATVEGPPDYSFQARELINKLNAMRRKAGGEVPEAKAMMAEINRLLELANKQKNAPGYEPPMPTDYHGEAQRLLQKLNAHRMEVGGEVPETQQVMAEVRRLQALGDQQRNAR